LKNTLKITLNFKPIKTKEMELKVKKEVEETINIEFPYYTKSSIAFMRFESENSITRIEICYNSFSIGHDDCFPDSWMLEEPSNEKEFKSAYESVIEKLKAL
jgi:hypothetical protein